MTTPKSTDCFICIETVSVKNMVKCPFCEFSACAKCTSTFLMGIDDYRPRCMSPDCKKVWSFEFLASKFPPSFHNKKYRDRCADLIYERERSLLPGTQELVMREKQVIKNRLIIADILDESNMLRELIRLQYDLKPKRKTAYTLFCEDIKLKANGARLSSKVLGQAWKNISAKDYKHYSNKALIVKKQYEKDIPAYLSGKNAICDIDECNRLIEANWMKIHNINEGNDEKKTRRVFTRACPVEKCRGFLSSSLKCGTCEVYACKDCHLPKTGKFDSDHKCDPDLVATIKMLADETKPCPSCTAVIYKISGCFSEKTRIPMWNGTIKYASDIIIGDEIIGDDGSKRAVQSLVSGDDDMYEVSQLNATNYVVNSKHILVLKATGHKTYYFFENRIWKTTWFNHETNRFEIKNFDTLEKAISFLETITTSNIVQITVDEFINLPNSTKKMLCGFRSTGVNWTTKDVDIDPYILGTRIGDGTASNDNEINWAIPTDYIVNNRSTRLSLLAGIIDIDGYVSNNGKRVTLIQVNPQLSEQIIFLSRSLGFITRSRMRTKKQVKMPNQDEYEINISGEQLSEIPTLLGRKKCVNSEPNKDYLRTSITVTPVGKGTYYGWEIDNNKRFVMDDFTVLHNCDQMYCTQCHTAFSWKSGIIERGVIHNPHYYEFQRTQNNGVAPRVRGDVRCGGLPDFQDVLNAVLRSDVQFVYMEPAYLVTLHITNVELYRFPNNDQPVDNTRLRVDYLMDRIDEKKFKSKIKQITKKIEKDSEINMILTMFTRTMADLFDNIMGKPDHVSVTVVAMEELRQYTNNALVKIGHRFGNVTPCISNDWIYYTNHKRYMNLL